MSDYYLCPFCVSSWVCHGPHIEQKDLDRFYYRIRILQDDLAEFAKEIVLEHGDKIEIKALANLVEQKIQDRDTI
jgi:acetone carboxylase gamma subunit